MWLWSHSWCGWWTHFSVRWHHTINTKQYLHSIRQYIHVVNTRDDTDDGRKWVSTFFSIMLRGKVLAPPDLLTHVINIDTVIEQNNGIIFWSDTHCCHPWVRAKTAGVMRGYVLSQSVSGITIQDDMNIDGFVRHKKKCISHPKDKDNQL